MKWEDNRVRIDLYGADHVRKDLYGADHEPCA